MVLEVLCVEPIYPQYSRVLETCLALRYWFFEVLGSESFNRRKPMNYQGNSVAIDSQLLDLTYTRSGDITRSDVRRFSF